MAKKHLPVEHLQDNLIMCISDENNFKLINYKFYFIDSTSSIPGSLIFPLSKIAFLIVHLKKYGNEESISELHQMYGLATCLQICIKHNLD